LAAIEFVLILPILIILVFWLIDFARLIQADLIATNVSREGGSLVSRGINSGETFLNMLQASAEPLNLNGSGKIYVHRIAAGTSASTPNPYIDPSQGLARGALGVSSSTGSGFPLLGLPAKLYDHLTFSEAPQNAPDILELWVVEVYYVYKPITPFLGCTPGYDGVLVRSKSIF